MVVLLPVLALAEEPKPDKADVLVVYYSDKGHTKSMAEAVAQGAGTVEGVDVRLLSIAEATAEDVLAADAVIVGSPVYKANVAPQVQEFINGWPIKDERLQDKIGAAFATGSGISAGEELVQMDIIHAMLVCRMIVVGGPNASQPFGASAVTGEEPCTTPEEKDGEGYVSAHYLKKGEALGVRVAQIAARLNETK
jgi:NAD(P)H dehydrogenase (quinone)